MVYPQELVKCIEELAENSNNLEGNLRTFFSGRKNEFSKHIPWIDYDTTEFDAFGQVIRHPKRDLNPCLSIETRIKVSDVSTTIFNELLNDYVSQGKEDFETFSKLDTVYFFYPGCLKANLRDLLLAYEKDKKPRNIKQTWDGRVEVRLPEFWLKYIAANQDRAKVAQVPKIKSLWEEVWKTTPKKAQFAGSRLYAFWGVINFDERRLLDLYEPFLQERASYFGGNPLSDEIDFELHRRKLDMKLGIKLLATSERIAEIDSLISRNQI